MCPKPLVQLKNLIDGFKDAREDLRISEIQGPDQHIQNLSISFSVDLGSYLDVCISYSIAQAEQSFSPGVYIPILS